MTFIAFLSHSLFPHFAEKQKSKKENFSFNFLSFPLTRAVCDFYHFEVDM
jgi:hypothetical protein